MRFNVPLKNRKKQKINNLIIFFQKCLVVKKKYIHLYHKSLKQLIMSRTKTLNLHEWSKEDTIITLYLVKFGCTGLYLKTEQDVADFIGTSLASLKMQMANVRTLLGKTEGTLSDYSRLQDVVVSEYGRMTQFSLMNKVRSIINHDENELRVIFSKMGKNYDRMRRI